MISVGGLFSDCLGPFVPWWSLVTVLRCQLASFVFVEGSAWVAVQSRGQLFVCRLTDGTRVQVSICGIHRDPKVWGNPDEYIPERWVEGSPLEATDVQKKAFMPFGDGIRACVGEGPHSLQFEFPERVAILQARLRQ